MTEYSLIVAFTDESPSFCHGFEAGMLWQRMTEGERYIEQVVRRENLEVIRRMCLAQGYTFSHAGADDVEWEWITLRKNIKPTKYPRVNPHGLEIVKPKENING